MAEQIPYPTTDPFPGQKFADNPEPRCPCVLLLDTSGSMSGAPIAALNAGLATFRDELSADSLAMKRVEIAIVTFGGRVTPVSSFSTAEHFQPPTLHSEGDTPMGEAIEVAIDMVEMEKHKYKTHGITYFRPWIFMITDGGPTDGDRWKTAAQRVRDGDMRKSFAFFCIAVEGANMDVLAQITPTDRPIKILDGCKFRELFKWLSASQARVSRSTPGAKVDLPDTGGWSV